MAYNPAGLSLWIGDIEAPSVPRHWVYKHTDPMTTVRVAGYFADARMRGMRPHDIVTVIDTATPAATIASVASLDATTGAGDLTNGTAITATDSD